MADCGAAFGLDTVDLGQAVDEPHGVQVTPALPHATQQVAVSGRYQDAVRDAAAQVFPDLVCAGLLAFARERVVAGTAIKPAELTGCFQAKVKGVVVIPTNCEHGGPERQRLCEFRDGRVFRHENDCAHIESGGETGKRGACIAGAGDSDGFRTNIPGASKRNSGRTVLG